MMRTAGGSIPRTYRSMPIPDRSVSSPHSKDFGHTGSISRLVSIARKAPEVTK